MQESGQRGIPSYADTLTYEDYEVRVGDRLYVYVYSVDERVGKMFNPTGSGANSSQIRQSANSGGSYDLYTYLVLEDGCIDYPMVGRIPVRGKTTREIKHDLERELSSYVAGYQDYKMLSVEVNIVRFDSAQLAVRPDSVKQDIEQLFTDYEEFMPMFVEGILGLPTEDTAYLCEMYAQFLTDTVMGFAQTNAKAQEMFADVSSLQKALNTGLSRLHYLYPEWEIPTVYMFVSGFKYREIAFETVGTKKIMANFAKLQKV